MGVGDSYIPLAHGSYDHIIQFHLIFIVIFRSTVFKFRPLMMICHFLGKLSFKEIDDTIIQHFPSYGIF